MADSEKVALTAQNPQIVIVPSEPEGAYNQNAQVVYQQPAVQNVQDVYQPQMAGTTNTTTQPQVIYIQPTDSDVARQVQQQEIRQYEAHQPYGHQPRHRIPSDPDTTDPVGEQEATVDVVKWENFKMPIPINHAVFMRKVWCTLIFQLIFTAGNQPFDYIQYPPSLSP